MESSELKSLLEELINPLRKAVDDLTERNKALEAQVEAKARNLDLAFDAPHLAPHGAASGDPRAARSVTIATRPVRDSPDDPFWGTHKIDPGGLVQNSISGGFKGGE